MTDKNLLDSTPLGLFIATINFNDGISDTAKESILLADFRFQITPMAIRKISITIFILSLAITAQSFAQGTTTIIFPDFYHYNKTTKGDTSFVYECFDKNMHSVYMYNLKSVNEITTIKYSKVYPEYAWKKESIMSPPYAHIKLYSYEHPSPDIWLGVDPRSNKITRYKLYKDKIVRTDNVTLNNLNNKKKKFVFKYCKTEITSSK